MIGESCKNVAATGECTHYYNAFRTLISVAMPHARATNKSKVETWRRVSDWPRLDRDPRAPARLRRVAGGGVFIKRPLTDDYLWRLRFLQDLSGLSGLTLNALTGRLNEVDKSIRYAANSGHTYFAFRARFGFRLPCGFRSTGARPAILSDGALVMRRRRGPRAPSY